MKTLTGKFTFTVPESSPIESERGQKHERTFDYDKTESEQEAQEVFVARKLSIQGVVDDILKQQGRSNSYQAALAPHKESTVAPEDIVERMVRDYIRLGISEDVARQNVAGMLANK